MHPVMARKNPATPQAGPGLDNCHEEALRFVRGQAGLRSLGGLFRRSGKPRRDRRALGTPARIWRAPVLLPFSFPAPLCFFRSSSWREHAHSEAQQCSRNSGKGGAVGGSKNVILHVQRLHVQDSGLGFQRSGWGRNPGAIETTGTGEAGKDTWDCQTCAWENREARAVGEHGGSILRHSHDSAPH